MEMILNESLLCRIHSCSMSSTGNTTDLWLKWKEEGTDLLLFISSGKNDMSRFELLRTIQIFGGK